MSSTMYNVLLFINICKHFSFTLTKRFLPLQSSHNTMIGSTTTQIPKAKPSWDGWDPQEVGRAHRAAYAFETFRYKMGKRNSSKTFLLASHPGGSVWSALSGSNTLSHSSCLGVGDKVPFTEHAVHPGFVPSATHALSHFLLMAILRPRHQPYGDCM